MLEQLLATTPIWGNFLKAFGEEHGVEKLTTRKWAGTEDDAWAMAALAVMLCDAQGAYRGPTGPAYVFMTFDEIEQVGPRVTSVSVVLGSPAARW